MALVIKRIHQGIMILDEIQDERSQGILFVQSLVYLLGTIGGYVYFFKVLGPRLMENQKPFNVKNAMIIYNILQIVLNAYIFVKSSINVYRMERPFCQDVDYSTTPESMEVFNVAKLYMYLKLLDIGDTVFFLLRKSYRQISFLHMYHHCAMILMIWIGVKFYGGGGSGHWIAVINSAVHVVMFIYYLLTSIDSSWKQSFLFKKTLTQIQLCQFVFFIIVYGNIAVFPTCKLPRFLSFLFATQNVFMLFLFGEFYYRTYVKVQVKKV